jgi:hypothetical protein
VRLGLQTQNQNLNDLTINSGATSQMGNEEIKSIQIFETDYITIKEDMPGSEFQNSAKPEVSF